MKQRFSSIDVKVIAHELQESLTTLRLANVYDLSSKILLLKFAKPDNKKQLIIDSGFRCHLTDFTRTTAAAPSAFVTRLRKFLKTRRLTSVAQIGTDRILEFQFSDGQYRLFLEFFASGNVILTDSELKIITLLRNVPEGEGQEPQRVGLSYSLENRQNFNGVPPLTKERVREALKSSVEKNANAAAAGKKIKTKPGDELRRSLATTITELPPILVDHSFKTTKFDGSKKPAEILEDETLLDGLLAALKEARSIVEGATSSAVAKGYIFAKYRNKPEDAPVQEADAKRSDLLYEDFHPFLPNKFSDDPTVKVIEFDGFNKTVDEFFSSLEGQKLESRLTEREEAAKRKLEAARKDQAKRIEGLQEAQSLNVQKATAIEANVERVQEAMDAVNGLLQQGMDWVDISKLIEREQKRHNPVAEIIKLPLNLAENTITLLLGEEEEIDDEASNYETDSEASDSDDEEPNSKPKSAKQLEVEVNIALSPWANSRGYHEQKRSAAKKEEKTVLQSEMALKNAEQKISAELRKGLKQEKAVLAPIRKQIWFEKFIWFISTDGYLVLGGKDAQQNEMLYKRYLRKGDVYVHADVHGAATVIIKNTPSDPEAPIPPSTLAQAGTLAVCSSSAWDSKAGMGAWWVKADQVSKSAPTGEYLPTGSFMVRGQKNFLPPAQLLLGIGIMFKISEESKARHVKHRLYDGYASNMASASETTAPDSGAAAQDAVDDEASDIGSEDEHEDEKSRANPLQSLGQSGQDASEEKLASDESPAEELGSLTIDEQKPEQTGANDQPAEADKSSEEEEEEEEEEQEADEDGLGEEATGASTPSESVAAPSAQASTAGNDKQRPAKRGQRAKAKKIAAKYKDQDDEDREIAEAIYGSARGKQRAEIEAQNKAQREAELAAQKERRRAQHQRQQKETAEHEEVRRLMNEEGVEVLDSEEMGKMTLLDNLVGTPLPGDEILEAIPVCAPWTAMGKFKYKAKFQPGAVKKGKAVKEVFETWKAVSGKKGVVDDKAQDKERMWPREVELIKALKSEEAVNSVPVGKVRVMMAGGSGGSGGGKGGQQGKGGRGGRGSKKK
ncbi:Ribosome quality control complex subunit 2 [Colletotrichum spinosum]|uniref:Ribosome quality control complex subunit 2 n=1 Tax=Colletotrichum spinosum TaxID=1347390 RepID=A0A4R8Q7U5_9PEZI|nr:Ribosome quality control complex subunit 2 [Colletotrichum spinosum]